MNWYHYLAAFFSGAFLANFVPHFVKGICGDRFPTPFAKPPGKGLSSPTVNVLWGLLNLVAGSLLVRFGKIGSGEPVVLGLFFTGIFALSLVCSKNFAKKHAN